MASAHEVVAAMIVLERHRRRYRVALARTGEINQLFKGNRHRRREARGGNICCYRIGDPCSRISMAPTDIFKVIVERVVGLP